MSQKTSDTETTKAMLKALRERYQRPEWAFMTEVPMVLGQRLPGEQMQLLIICFPAKAML